MQKKWFKIQWTYRLLTLLLLPLAGCALTPLKSADHPEMFRRIATFPVYCNTDIATQTVAEILTATPDGNLLIYTDSQGGKIGFVNIMDPANPLPDGVVPVGGEPTSVAVLARKTDQFALAAVNTSPSPDAPAGTLAVINLKTRKIDRRIDLGGQPDSIAVSPDGRYAAIAIENERDEDLDDGRPPQSPPGFVVIVDLAGACREWKTRTVDLTGIANRFPQDPEPEFVDINGSNIAAVTLQENNHMVLIHLPDGKVIKDWPLGTVDLDQIDTRKNHLIELTDSQPERLREPDAVAWISDQLLATADEGDLDGGSRGFTLFDQAGSVLFTSGNAMEHRIVRAGHYPENRSEKKGCEAEGVEYGQYGRDKLLFVGSERSSVVAVYKLAAPDSTPQYLQLLPTGTAPEGLLALPQRNLFVVAAEEDSRADKIRSSITIYQRIQGAPTYPTIQSADRENGLPIPWGALSALAADPKDPNQAYTAYDSFYGASRIFKLDLSGKPALITAEIVLKDAAGSPVDLDVEGLCTSAAGGFWVVSEGAGGVDDTKRPVAGKNLLLKVAADGTIEEKIQLPDSVNALQRRFGFEGVAEAGSSVFVAFQREWVGDPDGQVRIGRYDTPSKEWTFYYYPLDAPESPNGGWVGLSEIIALENNDLAVIERDNQAGTDARIKRIYRFSVAAVTPQSQANAAAIPLVEKKLVRDLIPDLAADHGPILEKVEGLMQTASGNVLIVTDNDGVDDSSGETRLIDLGVIF